MSNMVPSWFLDAVRTGKVNGSEEIPSWFPSKREEAEGTEVTPMDDVSLLNPEKAPRVGVGKAPTNVKPWSYFNTPIVDRPLKGNSRRWGDAPETVKEAVQGKLVEAALSVGLDKKDTALLLAIAHVESGFNPDAAAGASSASGIGQFINKTGKAYKLTDENRWDVDAQIDAFVQHFIDNKKLAGDKGPEYIYAYHHDGPSLAYGGLKISRSRVMPLVNDYLASLESMTEGVDGVALAEEDKKTTG